VDRDFLAVVAGDLATGIALTEEHHQDDLVYQTVVGVVRQIFAVSCAYAPAGGQAPQTLYPVSGTAAVEEVKNARTWHRAPSSDLEFVGFVTTVEGEDG
jgi:hypothetical protein